MFCGLVRRGGVPHSVSRPSCLASMIFFYISLLMETSNAINAFSALSHASRLAVFRALVRAGSDGVPAGELAELIGVPPSTLSAHLKILEHAGLVTSRRVSRHIYYAARFDTVRAMIAFLTEDCCAGHPAICGFDVAACSVPC